MVKTSVKITDYQRIDPGGQGLDHSQAFHNERAEEEVNSRADWLLAKLGKLCFCCGSDKSGHEDVTSLGVSQFLKIGVLHFSQIINLDYSGFLSY